MLWFVCSEEMGVGCGETYSTFLLSSFGQEELAILRRQLEGKDGEMRRVQDEAGFKAVASTSADPTERGEMSKTTRNLIKDKRE